MNLQEIIPKDKDDINSVMKLKNYTFEEIQPLSKDLLGCLQDMNWPVARLVANYLRPFSNELTNEILEVFKSNDDMWKYWIIIEFFLKADCKIGNKIIHELIRMRDVPSLGEVENEVNEVARQALEHFGYHY